jgi:uncharacterized protein YbcI
MTDAKRRPLAEMESEMAQAISAVHLRGNGSLNATILQALMRIHHDHVGRGPARARTSIDRDTITVTMHDVFTTAEHALIAAGHGDKVLAMRESLQAAMHGKIIAAIESLTGREVAALISANHIEPDLSVEICLLGPRARAEPVAA